MVITVPLSFRADQKVRLGDETINLAVLAERVRQAMLTQDQKQVALRMDGSLTIQDQLDVMDRLREAGVDNIGIPTDLPAR